MLFPAKRVMAWMLARFRFFYKYNAHPTVTHINLDINMHDSSCGTPILAVVGLRPYRPDPNFAVNPSPRVKVEARPVFPAEPVEAMGSADIVRVEDRKRPSMISMGGKATAELRAELHRAELELSNWVAEREQRLGDLQVRSPSGNESMSVGGSNYHTYCWKYREGYLRCPDLQSVQIVGHLLNFPLQHSNCTHIGATVVIELFS